MDAIVLKGGVDLNSPPSTSKPGTLLDCLNYEVTTRGGYSRIMGVERFDGGPGVAQYKLVRASLSGVIGTFTAGDAIELTITGPIVYHGFVQDVASGMDPYVTLVLEGGTYTLFGGGIITCPATSSEATVGAILVVDEPGGTQGTFDASLAALAVTRRAAVLPVPGRDGSDVIGSFFLRNEEYAIRDLPVTFFEGGYYTDANEGAGIDITVAAVTTRHMILDAQATGYQSGYIVYDPTPNPGLTLATPIGSPTLTSLPVSGTIDGGYLLVPYSDSLLVSGGLPPYTWFVVDGGDEPPAPIEDGGDLSDIDFLIEQTPAALWRAMDTGGWQLSGMSRDIAFNGGTNKLKNYPRSLTLDATDIKSSAVSYPTSSTFNGAASTAPNADDGTNVALGTTSGQAILCKGFALSALPTGAQVLGIKVEIERSAGATNNTADASVVLTGLPGRGENKSGVPWPTSMTVATYGSATDTWGMQGLTTDNLKDANFGVLLVAKRAVEATPMNTALVDFVRVTVTYAERSGTPIFFWDGTSDVTATMLHAQSTNGDATISTLSGHLTISAAVNVLKPRMIKVGDQIRTAAAGGGDLLGLAASRDRNIFLPGQTDIDHNRSLYLFRQANFFGQDKYDAIYGVSGAGPAFCFDGDTIIKIRAPLDPKDDAPRHIAKHGDSLMLGYFGGALLATAPGNPFETRGDQGASAIEVGDRITGLAEMPGDALGIICQQQSVLLRGLTQLSYYKSSLSAKRGGIEYTAADMGRVIVADSFGLFAADTPESFAAAERNYLSVNVEPWLRERLQATLNTEQRYLRPVAALAIRSKNQYRMFFRDGYVLTMTMREEPEFTFQRFYEAGTGPLVADTAWPVRSVSSGIDASGRERIFCSFRGVKQGYLFELDGGNTLDGASIPHFIELNPISFGGAPSLVRFDNIFVGGIGHRYTNINFSRGRDFIEVDEAVAMPVVMGHATEPATTQAKPIRGSVDFGMEGYEFSFRFHGLSGNERPHTFQILWPDADPRGKSRGDRGGR